MSGSAEIFGRLLRRAREASGLTQSALAERAELSENAIRAFERAERFPRATSLDLIVKALDLDTEGVLLNAMSLSETERPQHRGRDSAAWADLERLLEGQDEAVLRLVLELAGVVVSSALVARQGDDQGPGRKRT